MKSGEGRVVCVTGGSGYIATWLVKLLLHRGYTVNATLRSLNDSRKIDHLLALEGAKERLHFFKADLGDVDSFDSAINGCEGVFHTASPCFMNSEDPQTDLIDPAVNGTLNVLRSCAKEGSVKRVVLTSSIAAVLATATPLTPEVEIDETWFSDPKFCQHQKKWYHLSKTLAEEVACKFAKDNGIDLVVMNPAWVIGPPLQPTLNESCSIIYNLIGAKTYPNASCGWVHVKDVVNAHIQAFEMQSANGRYCLVERVAHYSEIVKILRDSYPNLEFPDKCADNNPPMLTWKVSKEKAKTLGIDFIPIEICLKDTVESFKDNKFY